MDELKRQRDALNVAMIATKDAPNVLAILSDFRAKFDALIAEFNAEADSRIKVGQVPDIKAFIASRDSLVLATKDSLAVALGPESFARFHAHVQSEKSKMKVAIEE